MCYTYTEVCDLMLQICEYRIELTALQPTWNDEPTSSLFGGLLLVGRSLLGLPAFWCQIRLVQDDAKPSGIHMVFRVWLFRTSHGYDQCSWSWSLFTSIPVWNFSSSSHRVGAEVARSCLSICWHPSPSDKRGSQGLGKDRDEQEWQYGRRDVGISSWQADWRCADVSKAFTKVPGSRPNRRYVCFVIWIGVNLSKTLAKCAKAQCK